MPTRVPVKVKLLITDTADPVYVAVLSSAFKVIAFAEITTLVALEDTSL